MDSRALRSRDLLDGWLQRTSARPRQKVSVLEEIPSSQHFAEGRSTKSDAAMLLEQVYDQLNRIHATLAYLSIMKRSVPGISQFLSEAQHTYEQALAHYGSEEFESARELSAASGGLCQVVETIMARTLRADSTFPSSIPPPPKHSGSPDDSKHLREILWGVDSVLARVHWLIENGTLPLDDRNQVRRIAAWGEALHGQARHILERESAEDAHELVRAAKAAADSAEHVCRNWYLGRVSSLRPLGAEETI
jgi:hypothetical protein